MIQISQGVKGMSELGLYTNSLAAGRPVHLYLPGQVDTAVAPRIPYIERDGEMSRHAGDENDALTHQTHED